MVESDAVQLDPFPFQHSNFTSIQSISSDETLILATSSKTDIPPFTIHNNHQPSPTPPSRPDPDKIIYTCVQETQEGTWHEQLRTRVHQMPTWVSRSSLSRYSLGRQTLSNIQALEPGSMQKMTSTEPITRVVESCYQGIKPIKLSLVHRDTFVS
jgi:hypothetical protein